LHSHYPRFVLKAEASVGVTLGSWLWKPMAIGVRGHDPPRDRAISATEQVQANAFYSRSRPTRLSSRCSVHRHGKVGKMGFIDDEVTATIAAVEKATRIFPELEP
jgi:hypothetical protein